MANAFAMIMAGGSSEHLSVLTETRAEPAVPFGGKFRLIDFPLSNCVNSGIYNVAVLTQYKPRSLNDHIDPFCNPLSAMPPTRIAPERTIVWAWKLE